MASTVNNSGGPGGGGGIGTGTSGGIGSGSGAGLGPGNTAGTGGGDFRAGVNGVGSPVCIYCPQPEYSDEARKAKYQGTVLLDVTVTSDGRVINPFVIKGPGLGMEEKALAQVRNWKMRPALGPAANRSIAACKSKSLSTSTNNCSSAGRHRPNHHSTNTVDVPCALPPQSVTICA